MPPCECTPSPGTVAVPTGKDQSEIQLPNILPINPPWKLGFLSDTGNLERVHVSAVVLELGTLQNEGSPILQVP